MRVPVWIVSAFVLSLMFSSGAHAADDDPKLTPFVTEIIAPPMEIKTDINWLTHLSLFVDYGAVWNPPDRDYEFASLGSVGAGVRAMAGHFNAMAMSQHRTRTNRSSAPRAPGSVSRVGASF